MSKTNRKVKRIQPEHLHRGNLKPQRVAIKDLVSDWLYEADMRHEIRFTPRERWADEVWRFYWKTLD
jgi:hypothetical protein